MSPNLSSVARVGVLCAALCATSAAATAQVPEGWAITSSLGVESLAVVSPRLDQAPIPLTNIPDEIKLTINVSEGANAIALNADGVVVVGNFAIRDQDAVVLYTLQLNGLDIAGFQRFEIGRSFRDRGGILAIEAMPDGRFLFCVNQIYTSPVIGSSRFGVLDPVAGTVTPINSAVSNPNALAVSQDGSEMYVGTFDLVGGGAVFRGPASGGALTLLGATPDPVTGIDVDNNGDLVISMLNATDGLARMDLATGTFAPVVGTPRNLASVTVERATGNIIYCGTDGLLQSRFVHLLANGVTTTLGSFTNPLPSGIDLQNSARGYGTATPGSNTYTWVTRDTPGGIPLLGNSNFSLTLDASPGTAQLSLLVVSETRASTSLFGVQLLVDPATLITLPMASSSQTTVAIPIPNDPSLAGVVFHGQSLHLEASGSLAASAGITFGPILP